MGCISTSGIPSVNISLNEEVENDLTKEKVLSPFNYVLNLPGKGFRETITNLFNTFFEVPEDKLESLLEVVNLLHTASLVIDDIEDGSVLRRGSPAAHVKFGIPLSINAANYVYFVALNKLLKFNCMETVKLYTETMEAAHEGQGIEIYWRDTLTTKNILEKMPSVLDYEERICKKTCAFFTMILKLLQLFSSKSEHRGKDLSQLGNSIGLYFQIRDDFLNVTSNEYSSKKGFCEDISEGKLSYPVLLCLNSNDVAAERKIRLFEILKMHTDEQKLKEEVLEILRDSGSIDEISSRLQELKHKIIHELELLHLDDNCELIEFFKEFLFID